jgi:hypothetical protein
MRENRETSVSLTADGAVGRIGKARGRTPMMHDPEESDRPIVPAKPSNKAEPSAAERVEGRGLATGNMDEQNAPRTQRRVVGAPSALDHVRQRAKQDRKAKFTTLLHHVTVAAGPRGTQFRRNRRSPGFGPGCGPESVRSGCQAGSSSSLIRSRMRDRVSAS